MPLDIESATHEREPLARHVDARVRLQSSQLLARCHRPDSWVLLTLMRLFPDTTVLVEPFLISTAFVLGSIGYCPFLTNHAYGVSLSIV